MQDLIKWVIVAIIFVGGYFAYDYYLGECPEKEIAALVEDKDKFSSYLEEIYGDISIEKVKLKKDKKDKSGKTYRGRITFERKDKEYTRPIYIVFEKKPTRMNLDEQKINFGIDYRCYTDDKFVLIEDADVLFDIMKSGKSIGETKGSLSQYKKPPKWLNDCQVQSVEHISKGEVLCVIKYAPAKNSQRDPECPYDWGETFTVKLVVKVAEDGQTMTWELKDPLEDSRKNSHDDVDIRINDEYYY